MDIQTLGVLAIVFISTFVSSTFGFGVGMISMPLLALIIDLKTATPLMAIMVGIMSIIVMFDSWKDVNFRTVWKLIASSALGIPVGLFFLKGTGDSIMKAVLALVIILFALYSLFGKVDKTLKAEWPASIFGFFGGVIGSAYNMGGPPIIIYGALKKWQPSVFRVNIYSFFLPLCFLIVASQWAAGLLTESVRHYTMLSTPVVIFTTITGGMINRRIPAENFNRYIHIFLLLIGFYLLFKVASGLF